MTRIFILSLLAGLIGMIVANNKGRNAYGWFVICFLFPLSVLVLFFLPPLVSYDNVRRCADCGNIIRDAGGKCPSCNSESPINMVTCRSCGVIVKEERVCDSCGKPL